MDIFWKYTILTSGKDHSDLKKTKKSGICLSMYSKCFYFVFYRGWEQLEVTCNPVVHHSHNLWNVEDHQNERGNITNNIIKIVASCPLLNTGFLFHLVF